jgi:uncharacterized protein YjiK
LALSFRSSPLSSPLHFMENKYKPHFIFFLCTLLTFISCECQKQKFTSPPGYDFSNPKKYKMPDFLREISGIAFNKGNNGILYAEEDENGKVFHFKLGEKKIQVTHFAKKGDFEDIAVSNNYVVMLRSDGVLFTFPFSETEKPEADEVKVFDHILPTGEYEGLTAIDSAGEIFVLSKHSGEEKTTKWGGGSILKLDASGNLQASGNFEISIKEIDALSGSGKIKFHPSALSWNPFTQKWYILSSVNKLLVITDENWTIRSVYPLDPSLFNQPEGIAFDQLQNLYISNERGQSWSATVLMFAYQKK